MYLPILSDPALAVRVVSAYSAGEISEATKGHAILLRTCQYSCYVLQRGGAGKTSEACNGPAIKFDLPILLSDPACSAGEISEALKVTLLEVACHVLPQGMCPPSRQTMWLCFFFVS